MDHYRETTKRYALPPHVKKRGAALLEQQMWCWGQDIRCPEENLLLRYGFTRVRSPEGISGSSASMLPQDDDHTMTLWGFGLFYAQRSIGGIFIRCVLPSHLFSLTIRHSHLWSGPQKIFQSFISHAKSKSITRHIGSLSPCFCG